MYDVNVIADSVCREGGARIRTITATYPRAVHSECLTHRDRARNSASSRAIPWSKMLANINEDPFIPIRFGSEQKGMQTGAEIDNPAEATRIWLEARDNAVRSAQALADLGVHKSICNRVTEPWMWITIVMTATEWSNFFRLRCHPDAEIHMQRMAEMVRDALAASQPRELNVGEWHLPFIKDDERHLDIDQLLKMSTARCARVSYLTHDGVPNPEKDLALFEKLIQGSGFGHYSPMEHPAMATGGTELTIGHPFRGYLPYRKMFSLENTPG